MAFSGANVGGTLYISLALPSADTAGAYNALTWTTVSGVEKWPEAGDTVADITFTGIDGNTVHMPGAVDGGVGAFAFRSDELDAGQIALRSVNNSTQEAAFRFIAADGKKEYSRGLIANVRSNPRDATTYIGFTGEYRVNSRTIRT